MPARAVGPDFLDFLGLLFFRANSARHHLRLFLTARRAAPRLLFSFLPPRFPALQSQPILRPLFTICDPFLNTFRQVVPPVFGLDLSPILAIFLLQTLGTASVALGAEERDHAPLRPPRQGARSGRTPAEAALRAVVERAQRFGDRCARRRGGAL